MVTNSTKAIVYYYYYYYLIDHIAVIPLAGSDLGADVSVTVSGWGASGDCKIFLLFISLGLII